MSFATSMRLNKRVVSWVSIAVLVVTTLLPALIQTPVRAAAQMGDRSIAIDDSSNGHTDSNYTVDFDVASTDSIAAVVVDFCAGSPIVGDTCTAPTGFTIADVETAGAGTAITSESANIVSASIDPATDANTLVLGFTATGALSAGDNFTFVMGDGDTDRSNDNSNGVTNPTNSNTSFYARIITYDTVAHAAAYASNNLGTGDIDGGGIALSTANQLTVTARVQEVLEFCVGNADADSASDCTDISGTTIDMGVLDASSITESSDRYPNGETHGYLMMRTNALNGLTLSYLGDTLTSGANSITAVGASEGALTANTEGFGIDIVDVDDNTETASTVDESNGGGATTLTLDTDWDTFGDWTYAGSATTADTIATSASVLDDVMLILDFGGTVDNLVPTGLYTTTITFIATGLF